MAEIEIKTNSDKEAPEMPEPKPNVNLNFPSKAKVQPEGYDGIALGDEISVVIAGKVDSLSAYSGEYGSKTIGIELASCKIVKPEEKPMGLGDAVYMAKKKIK